MAQFEKDLSQGHVGRQLLSFALPFIISNLIQSLYSVADMVIVGQFSGTLSMSGVNIGSQVTMLVTNLVFGLSAAATVLIAQYKGAGQREHMQETIDTLFASLFALGTVLTVIMVFLRTPILRLIQTPEPAFEEASRYLLVTALGTLFIFGYNALSAIMRGLGDSRRPLWFVAISCVVNIGLDLLMVAVWHWGAFGAGLATIISQALSVILCLIYLKKSSFSFSVGFHSMKFHRERLSMLLKVGIPMSVQNVCTSISFLFLTAMVNILDPTAVASAAVGAVGKFNMFGVLPAFAMSNAVSAMSAQNIGAGRKDRAAKTMFIGMGIAFAISACVFLVAQLFPDQILRAFADDPSLMASGREYLRSFSYDYLLVPLFANLTGLFIGAGHTTFSFISGVCSALLVRIPVCYLFGMTLKLGLFGVGLGAPFASGFSFLLGLWFYFSGRWKRAVILHREVTE